MGIVFWSIDFFSIDLITGIKQTTGAMLKYHIKLFKIRRSGNSSGDIDMTESNLESSGNTAQGAK